MKTDVGIVVESVASILGPVNPWLALLWLLSALVLAGLIVYGWQRVFPV